MNNKDESKTNTVKIEKLNTAIHDRDKFSCGVKGIDNFFKKTANKHMKSKISVTYVASDSSNDIVGFYTICSHSVKYDELNENEIRGIPKSGVIPASYIIMFAIDEEHQRKKNGKKMMIDCLKKILNLSDDVGINVIVLDIFDCGDEEKIKERIDFYKKFGFTSFVSNRMRMYLPIKDIKNTLTAKQ